MPATCDACAPATIPMYELVLAVGLDDERDLFLDGRRRVVRPELADVAVDLVVRHRGLVRERVVLVDVDVDGVRRRVPEDVELVRLVPVAVEVAARRSRDAEFASEARVRLVEERHPEGARGRRERLAVERERRAADLGLHVQPGRIEGGSGVERARARDPVDDLRLTGARGEQARVVERDAGVDDADRDAAAVPGRVRVHELCCARVLGRHVRVLPRSRRVRRRAWDDRCDAGRGRVANRDFLVDVDREQILYCQHRLQLVERHGSADVVDAVLAVTDRRAEFRQLGRDAPVRLPLRGDDQRDRRLASRFRQRDEGAFVLRELDCRARGARRPRSEEREACEDAETEPSCEPEPSPCHRNLPSSSMRHQLVSGSREASRPRKIVPRSTTRAYASRRSSSSRLRYSSALTSSRA